MTSDEARAILCITTTMHDFRSCTHRDAHTVTCDGFEYAWTNKRRREEATGKKCTGCRPREARHGHLCLADWEKVQTALSDWYPFEAKIRGVERAVQRDNGGIRGQSLGYVPIPNTILAVEEIRSYLKTMTGNSDLWVSTVAGAKDAVRFARAVSSAIRTHAVEEKAHHVKRTRCTSCKQLTLVWNPVLAERGDVTVKCTNAKCGAELDQTSFEKVAAIERPCCRQCKGDPRCINTACQCHVTPDGELIPDPRGGLLTKRGDDADPYDPTNPDHQALLEEPA